MAGSENVVVHCNVKENENLINKILEADSSNRKYNPYKNIVLKSLKKAIVKVFEAGQDGKREIDKIINIASGQSKKNLERLKRIYDKNPNDILNTNWIQLLNSFFYSHDLLRDLIALMVTYESEVLNEVLKYECVEKSEA